MKISFPKTTLKAAISSTATSLEQMATFNLPAYSGPWDRAAINHFLRRTTLGHTYADVTSLLDLSHADAVDLVLTDPGMPSLPINYDEENDPNVPIGETWVETPLASGVNGGYRRRSMQSWIMRQAMESGLNVKERMVIFWHNHFVTANIADRRFTWEYMKTIHQHGLGNFKAFVDAITIDPSMLRYLNGNVNTKNAPNENYARELLELFTIGKGPLAGPGDYTNYTEDDIVAIARVLTGWRDRGHNSSTNPVYIEFRPEQHDTDTKQLSHRFDNQVIENADENEYKVLLDIIFSKDEVARYMCRKFYRYFVSDQIDEAIESNVIEPLAQIMIANNYEIAPTLEALFLSDAFMKEDIRGVLIKNPMEFLMSTIKSTGVNFDQNNMQTYHTIHYSVFFRLRDMQMEIYNHDSVAGWQAYYQAPGFSRLWLSAVTMPQRQYVTDRFTRYQYNNSGIGYRIYPLDVIENLPNPYDPNVMITDLAELFYPNEITENQVNFLKSILIPGLPDFEWTTEYADYLADPDNVNLKNAVEDKLRDLFQAMMSLSEFYLF